MSFFDGFDQVVPNYIKVEVGKKKPFILDSSKKNGINFKGKQVACLKKAETVEEMKEHGIGTYMEYLPAEEVSLPIDLTVTSPEKIRIEIEKTSKYTNKERTGHTVRIFDDNGSQVGFTDIDITPSGDIEHSYRSFCTHDLTKELTHIVHRDFLDGKINIGEMFWFEQFYDNGSKSVKVYQNNGKVVGACAIEKERKNKDGLKFPELKKSSDYINSRKTKSYVSSCVSDETDRKKRELAHVPWECYILEHDLFEYKKSMDEFNLTSELLREESGIDFTIEKAIELGEKHKCRPYEIGVPPWFNYRRYYELAKYLSDDNNDRLRDFKGTYIGNILKLRKGEGYEACIVSKHIKDEQEYRLYTLIDFTGTSITKGTNPCYEDEKRDENYFNRLKEADKNPTFVTRMNKDGKEELVLYHGETSPDKCEEYEQFVKDFILPFEEVKPFKIDKIVKKQKEKEK